MAVKIRFKRMGAKKAPFYRIVVADSRSPRNGAFIEELGYYNPATKETQIEADKAKDWVGKGAQQLVRAAFKTDCGEHSVVLPGVVSRKKQMVVPLVRAMEHDEEIE